MKSRPGQGLTVISKKIRPKQNDHASRRTQRSPHTRREQHPVHPSPTASTPPKTTPRPSPCDNRALRQNPRNGNRKPCRKNSPPTTKPSSTPRIPATPYPATSPSSQPF